MDTSVKREFSLLDVDSKFVSSYFTPKWFYKSNYKYSVGIFNSKLTEWFQWKIHDLVLLNFLLANKRIRAFD